jgi:hypothetical protein
MREMTDAYKILVGKPNHVGVIGIDGRIILKWILHK